MFDDEERIQANIEGAGTDDLLDRVTAYRAGMEPRVIDLIEAQLRKRGVTPAAIAQRDDEYQRDCVFQTDGCAVPCSFCACPAVLERWGWHKLFGLVPIMPRQLRYCKAHAEDITPT